MKKYIIIDSTNYEWQFQTNDDESALKPICDYLKNHGVKFNERILVNAWESIEIDISQFTEIVNAFVPQYSEITKVIMVKEFVATLYERKLS